MVTSPKPFGMAGQRTFLLAVMLFSFVLLSLVGPSSAHMVMSEPPPINYPTNPYYIVSKADFDYTAPLTPTGSNYPCRGHLVDLDTPQGQSVRTYKPGSTISITITGSAVHGGGSCQISLSYDKGKTWTVIKSFIGNCPHAVPGGDQTFQVPIPTNAPTGVAVFAWTWFNNVGNREMYMNCAVVTIGSSGSKLKARALSGPSIFLANIGNGCTTAPNTDVVFPNPGSVVEYGGNSADRAPPVGSCQGQVLTGGGGDTSGGNSGNSGNSEASGTSTMSSIKYAPTGTSTGAGGQDVQGNLGCDYWRTQGYVCSATAPALLGQWIFIHIFFGFLAFAWVCGFLGTF